MNITLSEKQHILLDPMEYTQWNGPTKDEFFDKALNDSVKSRQMEKYEAWKNAHPGETFHDFLYTLINSRNQRPTRMVKLAKNQLGQVMLPGGGTGALSARDGPESRAARAQRHREFKDRADQERRKKMREEMEKEEEMTKADLRKRKPIIEQMLKNYTDTLAGAAPTYNEIKREIIRVLEEDSKYRAWQTKEKEKLMKELEDAEEEKEEAERMGDTRRVKILAKPIGKLKRMLTSMDFQGIYPQEKKMVQDYLRGRFDNNFRFRMSGKITLVDLKKLATQHKIKGRSKMNKAQLMTALAPHMKSVKKSRKPAKKSRKPVKKPVKKPAKKPAKKKSRKPAKKKSRKPAKKPVKKKSRKPAKKKSRKPVKKKSGKRIYLHVPFSDKEEVKALGAKWDAQNKQWFYEKDNIDPLAAHKLDKWPADTQENPLALLSRGHDSRNKNGPMGIRNPSSYSGGRANYYVEKAKNNRSKDYITKQRIPAGTVKILEKYYGHDDYAWRSYFIDSLFDSMERRSCDEKFLITGPEDYFIDPDMPGAKEAELRINKRANDLRISRAKKCKNYKWVPAISWRRGGGGRFYVKSPSKAKKSRKVRKSRKAVSKSKRKPAGKRIYLVVPYIEKDEVKRLGGRWDPKERKWYYFEGSKNTDKLDYWRR